VGSWKVLLQTICCALFPPLSKQTSLSATGWTLFATELYASGSVNLLHKPLHYSLVSIECGWLQEKCPPVAKLQHACSWARAYTLVSYAQDIPILSLNMRGGLQFFFSLLILILLADWCLQRDHQERLDSPTLHWKKG